MKKFKNGIKLNTNFNRYEHKDKHVYINETPAATIESFIHEGYIKLKLFHTDYGSLIIPDQVYLKYKETMLWIQVLYFSPNILFKDEDDIIYTQSLDISCGIKINIKSKKSSFIRKLDDDSYLYECEIVGPRFLHEYTTGMAKFIEWVPFLRLYHHTDTEAKKNILKTNEFWTSPWNIQGTKELLNCSFLYLTCLDKIKFKEDLELIAMSINEKLGFILDQNIEGRTPDLVLKVYRGSTDNRNETLQYWVNSTTLLSQPIYKHTNFSVYYQVVCPFIYRIGSDVNKTIRIEADKLIPNNPKNFKYVILGDCSLLEGLEAPYDEENTRQILKVEEIDDGVEIFEFWFNNSNSDRFDKIIVDEHLKF